MADEGIDRTFSGDPNAPPQAPAAAAPVRGDEAPVGGESMTAKVAADGSSAQDAPSSVKHPKPRMSVVQNDDGSRDVFSGSKRIGGVNVPGADKVLASLGAYNPDMKVWDDVPEDVARKLLGGRLPLVPYLEAKWAMGEAGTLRGMTGRKWLSGEMSADQARAQGNPEMLAFQLREAPIFAWQGDFGATVAKMWDDFRAAGVGGTAQRTAGEVAQALPDLLGMGKDAAKDAAAAGVGAAVVVGGLAATGITEGAAAPAALAAAQTWAARGASFGVFKHTFDVASGNAGLDMLDKGFEENTAKKLAPVVGAINGALMVGQARFMTAGLRRTFAGKILASETIKGVIARYVADAGVGTSLAAAQKAVDIAVNDVAAKIDERPDLVTDKPFEEIINAAVTAAPVMAALGLPGAALEGARVSAGKTIKAAEPAAGGITEGKTQVPPAAGSEGAAPAAEGAAPSAAGKPPATAVIDSKGDYFPSPEAEKLQKTVEAADAGKASTAELQAAVDEATAKPVSFGEKVSEVQRRAAQRQLEGDLADVQVLQKELTQARDRWERNGKSTRLLDKKLEELGTQEQEIKNGITFYEAAKGQAIVTPGEKLQMSPTTLENAVQLGFTEGRKEVLDVRRKQILNVAERLDMTPAELREAMGARNYGVMSDAEFNHWFEGGERKNSKTGKMDNFEGFVDKAKALTRERFAREEVIRTIKEREITGERNIRALHKFPPIKKMTEQQLHDFVDVLNTYDQGSKVLTAKSVEALKTGEYRNARTMQDVLALAANKLKQPIEKLLGARRDQFDYLRGDVALAEKHPLYAAVVDPVQRARARAAANSEAWHEVNVRLGAEALASRKGLASRFLDPTMPEVVKHLETDPVEVYAGLVDAAKLPQLTAAEHKYVNFLRDSFGEALSYLKLVEDPSWQSRFEGTYYPHVKQSFSEVIKSIPERGVRKALGEMVDGVFNSQDKLTISNPQAFGYRKFFKQSVFRTGELTPSKEVMRVADNYMRDFFDKQELDVAGPEALTLARSILALETDKSPDAAKARAGVEQFVKDYLNNKKGINLTAEKLAPRGGAIDAILRATSSFISATRIALNLPLELTAPIGENMAATQVTGHGGYLRAQARMLTEEGQAFLKNYESFTGRGQFETLFEPGRNVEQRAATVMYGALQAGRTHALKSILLALATPEEIKAGKMAPGRLAEIERQTGRWVDIHGLKSIVGSTTPGAAYTKFRTWMLPIMRSTVQDLGAALQTLRGGPLEKRLTSKQAWELTAAVVNSSVAATALYALKPEDDDHSFWANTRRKAVSELFSILQGANPTELLRPGPVVKFYEDLYSNLKLLYTMETYKTGDREGELKGPPALKRQLVPAMFRQFTPPEEK